QKEIAEMQNETQKEIAGIQSATSRQNTKDQVYAQNEMLAYQQKESTARVASIMENTNLSKQQQVSEIMRQMLTQAQTAGQYFRCCHLKNIWTAPLPPETELSRQMTTSTTSIDIMGLQAAYANLHTDQERDYFMQRYHDVISSFGGKTSYDADNRPLLVMRSNLWASGYDVDGTD